jgi:hypothetical protein
VTCSYKAVIFCFRDATSSSEGSSFSPSMSSLVNSIVPGGPWIFGGGRRRCTLGVGFDEADSVRPFPLYSGLGINTLLHPLQPTALIQCRVVDSVEASLTREQALGCSRSSRRRGLDQPWRHASLVGGHRRYCSKGPHADIGWSPSSE